MIENNDNRSVNDDDAIRRLIQATQKRAPDDFKFRVMHNIEMDSILSRRYKSKKTIQTNPLKDFWSIFGAMYLVIAIIIGFAYFTKGFDYIQSKEMVGIIIIISFAFSLYWLITKMEERYRSMHKKR